jgi:hypothetical protein
VARVLSLSDRQIGLLCDIVEDRHQYIIQISRILEPLADAILMKSSIPSLPTLDQICQGISIALNDHKRENSSNEPSATFQNSSRASSCLNASGGTLVDCAMMNQMIRYAMPAKPSGGPTAYTWPAALYPWLTGSPRLEYLCFINSSSSGEIHLLPILLQRRWTLFAVDPRRGVIDHLDFLSSSTGCEMSTYQVSLDKPPQAQLR